MTRGNRVIASMHLCIYAPMCACGCVHLSRLGSYLCTFVLVCHRLCVYSPRYNGEGRVTNITLPTGEVSGFHGNLERWSRVEVEASNRENFVTSTNLSASDTIYTFKQGIASWSIVSCFLTPNRSVGTLVSCRKTKEFTQSQIWWLRCRKDYSLATVHLPHLL